MVVKGMNIEQTCSGTHAAAQPMPKTRRKSEGDDVDAHEMLMEVMCETFDDVREEELERDIEDYKNELLEEHAEENTEP